jgi:hypothetical protein
MLVGQTPLIHSDKIKHLKRLDKELLFLMMVRIVNFHWLCWGWVSLHEGRGHNKGLTAVAPDELPVSMSRI